MPTPEKFAILRSLALAGVFAAGLLSIVGTTGSGGQPPDGAVACAGRDQQVKTGSVVQLDGSCSRITEYAGADDYLRFTWQVMEGPAGVAPILSDRRAVDPSFTVERDGRYVLLLTAGSTPGLGQDTRTVTITATADNDNAVPVAHAGYTRHIKVGDEIELDGSRSYDADGDLLTYAWTVVVDPSGQGYTLTGADTAKPMFSAPGPGTYHLGLKVDDGAAVSDRNIVRIRVTRDAQNACPDADAGPDQRVMTGPPVLLDGSRSTDADQDSIAFNWRMVWRPEGSNAGLRDPFNNKTTRFDSDVDGAYVIQLTAEDQDTSAGFVGNCVRATLDVRDTVVVVASSGNSAPVADAGADRIVAPGDSVQLDASGSSDANGDALGYLWQFVSLPPGSLAILSDVTDTDPVFVADLAGSYVLQLTVTDGFASDSDTMVVTATAGGVGQTRPLADAGADQTVAVGATVMLDGSNSSDPNGDMLNFAWSFIDWPGAPLSIQPVLTDASTSTPSFVAADAGDYVLRLVVNDGAEDSVADTVRITAQAAGACADPLNLVTTLPFIPGLGEVPTVIQIDGDDVNVIAADVPLDIDAMQAGVLDMANPDLANFIVLGPTWEETSRTHANPISDTDSPSFVIRQTVDDIYYKLDVDFTGDPGLLEVRIDDLDVCRCGNDPGDCP